MTKKKLSVDAALDPQNMPEGKNWMSVAPDVVRSLRKHELYELMSRTLLAGGQTEHQVLYRALERTLGTQRTVDLIEKAKRRW